MKQFTKFLTLTSILVIGFFLGTLVATNVKGDSDLDVNYTFERDVLFEQDDTDFYQDFNTREYEVWEDTGEFPATYSFTNVPDDTSGINIPFVDTISGGTAFILAENDGHTKVLNFTNTGGFGHISNNFDINHTSGVSELWLKTTNAVLWTQSNVMEGDTFIVAVGIYNNKFYYHSAHVKTEIGTALDNTWYHFKMKWYANSTYDLYVDGNLIIAGADCYDSQVNGANNFRIRCGTTTAYVDAIGYYFPGGYTGEHFDVGTQDIYPIGIDWDGSNLWVVGDDNNRVYEYSSEGIYTETYFNVSSQDTYPRGITWDDSSFWVIGADNGEVYQYNSAGTYTGEHFNVGNQDFLPRGITWDGSSFWVISIDTKEVYKYYANGTYTGFHFDVETEGIYPMGITWDSSNFWITCLSAKEVYKYYANGTYTGFHFDVGDQDVEPRGIVFDGTYFWIVGADNNEVYQYLFPKITYEVGDNLESLIILIESGTEVDRWEFAHKELFDRLDDGDDNPTGWTDLEDGEDDVNCRQYDDFDGVVELYANSGDAIGLYKDNLGYSNDIVLNVSFGFEIKYIYSVVNNDVYLKVYSSDNTEIIRIRINDDGTLKYWISGTTYTTLDTGFAINTNYSINLSVDYETDVCILRYDTNEVFTDSFEFPLTVTGKTGLKKVSFNVCADTDYCQVYLDYAGIYVNNRSITTDFGSIGLHISNHSYWYFNEYNLLTVNIIGDGISIYLDLANYVSTSPDFVHEILISAKDYTGLEIINMYDYLYDEYWGYDYMWGGVLWFHFYDTFEFNSTTLEGVKLIEGENEYSLEFAHSGVNVMDNYFYVIDNVLYFSQTSNDTNLEYIQATFDVDNLESVNRSVNYRSILSGNAKGFLSIKYTDSTSTLMSLRTVSISPNVILPQDKTITKLIVLITDNDNDDVQGTTTGSLEYVKLRYLPDVGLTLITLNLLSIMIPIMILIIPTLLFYFAYGKKIVIPIFMLMAIICFITNMIPLWLFFIIMFASGSFIFIGKITDKRGE